MGDLNLDNDGHPMVEDSDKQDCVLCKYSNYDYLLQLQQALSSTTSKRNMYAVMFEAFKARMKLLKSQDFDYVEIDFPSFQNHFENHLLNLRRLVAHDIRLVKGMQQVLLQKMRTKTGLNSSSVNTWVRLSQHKMSLAAKLKPIPKIVNSQSKPHEFN